MNPPTPNLQELLLKGILKGFGDFITMFWPYLLVIVALAVFKWKLEAKEARRKRERREQNIRRDEEIREEVRAQIRNRNR
jgi:large-conductance mechanosensitive channel